jgi:hypothetical protein
MTQPPQEAVGGGSDDVVIAAEPTIEDRFAAIANAEPQDEETPSEEADETPVEADAESEAELEPEDVPDEADEELPPIKPPVSWTAEEQEEFKQLPRALQETLTRRESERERFVQAKAQEAKQTRSQVETEAVAAIQRIQDDFAAKLQVLTPQVQPPPPRTMLDVNSSDYDPDRYHYLKAVHDDSLAQAQYVQQQIEAIHNQRSQLERAQREQAVQRESEALRETLPEWFDATEGPKLHATVKSIASELGYSAEQVNDATATEIVALARVSEWKAKADKLDTLNARKMEKVREARGMPKVSKPGVPQGKGALANQRYTADRNAMKQGDPDATARVFARFVNS